MPTAMNYTNLLQQVRRYIERGNVTDTSVYEQLPYLVTLAERRCATELKIQGFEQVVTTSLQPSLAVYPKPDRWRVTTSINMGVGRRTVRAVTVTDGGSGYEDAPAVTFSGGAGTGAAATAFLTNGVVTQIAVTDPGSGYTSAPTVTIEDSPTDDNATATAQILTANDERRMLLPRSYEFIRSFWPNDTLTDEDKPPAFYADYNYTHWIIAPTPALAYPIEIIYYEQPALLDDANQTNWLTDYAPQLLLYATLLETAPLLKAADRETWQAMYDRAAAAFNGQDLAKILDRAAKRQAA